MICINYALFRQGRHDLWVDLNFPVLPTQAWPGGSSHRAYILSIFWYFLGLSTIPISCWINETRAIFYLIAFYHLASSSDLMASCPLEAIPYGVPHTEPLLVTPHTQPQRFCAAIKHYLCSLYLILYSRKTKYCNTPHSLLQNHIKKTNRLNQTIVH